jgi:hypothetical protein
LLGISISFVFNGCTANSSGKDSTVLGDKNSVEGYNEKLLSINDLTEAFYHADLHLKPQADDGFLDELILNDVKPVNFELLDDGIYFYIFKSQQDAEIGLDEIVNLPYSYFQRNTEIYNIKNALIFYTISSGNEFVREQYKQKIEQIVRDLHK